MNYTHILLRSYVSTGHSDYLQTFRYSLKHCRENGNAVGCVLQTKLFGVLFMLFVLYCDVFLMKFQSLQHL